MSSNDVKITKQRGGLLQVIRGEQSAVLLFPWDVAALRAYFATERMPEDVRELVDEAFRQIHDQDALRRYSVAEVKQIVYPLLDAFEALEAAQRSLANPVVEAIDTARESIERGERASVVIDTDDYPQRPPVSPEARESGIDAATVAVEGLLASIEKGSDHGPRDIAEAALDAARFSVPSQPVYDESKIARWLSSQALDVLELREFAAVLVEALPSLTKNGS